jgi:steroid delta-isomerase-like uncharacterized protein
MSADSNAATTRRILDEAWNQGRLEVLDETVAEDFVNHDPADPEDLRGREAFKERVRGYRTAMPDLKVTIEELIASDEFVATRWTATGTNDGELQGMPATHRAVTITGNSIDRFDAQGRLVETWDQWDNLGFMQRLGLIPEMAAQGAG